MCVCVCARPGDRCCLCLGLLMLVQGERTVKEKTCPHSSLLSLYHPTTFAGRGWEEASGAGSCVRGSGPLLPRAWATLSAGDSSFPWAGVTPAGAISSSGCAVVFGIKKPARQKHKKRKEKKNKKTRKTLEGSKRGTSEERCRESAEKRSEGGEQWGRN